MLCQAFVLLLVALCAQCSINKYPRIPVMFTNQPGDDAGSPLVLTDYIEANKTKEGRNLSQVVLPDVNLTSYAGYFRVNATADKKFNSSLFFWFFPAEVNASSAPVLVWLQGGPGASSMFGLFQEHGPLVVSKTNGSLSLLKRKIHWALNHNVIYIDNPVGTGFSYVQHPDQYSRNESHVGVNLYVALKQFFTIFPEYQKNDFYVTGESYAGKYVPALAYTIHINNPVAKTKINLKGVAIGNGLCDPLNMMVYSSYLYQLGLIDENAKKLIEEKEKKATQLILEWKWDDAFNEFDSIINGDFNKQSTIFKNVSGFTNYFNYLVPIADNSSDVLMQDLFKNATFRKSIHVGDAAFNSNDTVEQFLKQDVMSSVKSWIEILVNATESNAKQYKILFYNGQLDIIVAYPLTVNFLKTLDWSGKNAYANVSRTIWYHNNDIAGYLKKVDNFYEVLVRNAGHMVPSDQPERAPELRETKSK
uniref:Carboxypeptidase n=1 Tax=Cacopsylla melanoneura TaxID=428564 RepID=A0A8D8PLP3_9HEMI